LCNLIKDEKRREVEAFKCILPSIPPQRNTSQPHKFVKWLEKIPQVDLTSPNTYKLALVLFERALVGKFKGSWPSPKEINVWVANKWTPLQKTQVSSMEVRRGFSLLIFSSREERDLIFCSGSYFMGSRGTYLSH